MAKNLFKNKTILITGGTGSFGKAMVRHVWNLGFKEIRIFSRDELKQENMRIELGNPRVKFHIGDVRDRDSVDAAMAGVDMVFHAAALKQVPSCEFFPMQAVMTNIVGSHNVIESAVQNGVSRVVCLGTDKAVYPINAMGTTKALMEKAALAIARALPAGRTVVSCVRYGNVMSSRGSVIPLFIGQIRAGKPITITDPRMTRFLLPLSQAIGLVVFALEHAEQGDILIRKAPAATIADLAAAIKQLFKSNVPVKTIGIRHGEKLHETLATREELSRAVDMGDFFRVRMDSRSLDYAKYFSEGNRHEGEIEDYTSANTVRLDVAGAKKLLLSTEEVRAELR
ncbi:MAG TPA: SDR family NAD(P)-dependent oxidoreductase [Elusimicrobiota bacterium]|jgi:UDP-glucose 4-epimerase|nr:SDR family NAD(P)-dependent oxidoreductase [Elusimicrobiota bacterium]